MTIVATKIRGYVAGDDLTIQRTVNNIPVTRTLAKAYLTIKADRDDADVDADLQLEINTVSQAQGEITDTGLDGVGAVEFNLTAAETAALGYNTTYHYDIQVILSNGNVDTPEIGTIRFRQGFTDATT